MQVSFLRMMDRLSGVWPTRSMAGMPLVARESAGDACSTTEEACPTSLGGGRLPWAAEGA